MEMVARFRRHDPYPRLLWPPEPPSPKNLAILPKVNEFTMMPGLEYFAYRRIGSDSD